MHLQTLFRQPLFRLCIWALALLPCHSAVAVSSPRFDKILIVILENTDFDQAIAQPALRDFAKQGAHFTNFYATSRPSQPNYIALISGSNHNVDHNGSVEIKARHIGNLLEEKGRSWKAYLDDYPGGCFTGGDSDRYVRKHNPFISFLNVQTSPERCARLVPAAELIPDLKNRRLPDFSIYVPNQDNNGHDTGIQFADRWLSDKFLPALGSPLPKGLLLVVTFDESGSSKDNRIYTALSGSGVRPGAGSDSRLDHYSLLRLVEDQFKLGTLRQNDQRATPITGIWRK